MRRASLSLTLVLAGGALVGAAGDAQALGFGRSVNVSNLGQPLNFAATVRLDADAGTISVAVDGTEWEARPTASQPAQPMGTGRELFALMRASSDNAEAGASAMLAMAGL